MKRRVYQQPKGITGLLVRLFISRPQEVQNRAVRATYGYLGGWVSALVNLLLSGLKLILGWSIGSQALIADALHSAGDMLTSVIVVFGFKWAKKPRDKEHPFGHAKAELVASLIMSVLLIVAGFELFRVNLLDLIQKEARIVNPDYLTIGLVAATILLKEWLYAFSKELGALIGSQALHADAWHHRLDSLTTGLVVVSLVANSFGVYWLDSFMGVVVSFVIMWSGVEIAKESISPLLGEMVDAEDLWEIRNLALQNEMVGNVHDIMVHKYGDCHFITMHMEILHQLSPVEMHDIAAEAADRINLRFNGDCNIHVDPVEFDAPRYKRVAKLLNQLLEEVEELIDFHDLQFRDQEGMERIHWEFSVDPALDESKYETLKKIILTRIQPQIEGQIFFSLEPGYTVRY